MIKINFKVFVMSLAVGMFIVYLTTKHEKVVHVYPTPENMAKYIYKDNADNCYTFDMERTRCPLIGGGKTIEPQ